jgi:hypothetical protein
MRGPLPRLLRAAAFLLAAAVAGCATHGEKRAAVEKALVRGDYAAALQELDKKDKDDSNVLYLLDRGLLLHYLGRFAESNASFESAEFRIEDLYTRSLSREAASLVTSDMVLPYEGAFFERALVHYYRILNYLYLDDQEGALVECRKADLLMAKMEDRTEGSDSAYRDDAFLEYLTAMVYEDAGEWNDAWVSLRRAEAAYAGYEKRFGVPAPPSLGADLRRISRTLGLREEAEIYRERYRAAAEEPPAGEAELVFLLENGLAPLREELEITIPILKGETDRFHDDVSGLAVAVAGRYPSYDYGDAELDYLLRLAVPGHAPRPPRVRSAEVRVDTLAARTFVAENVAALSGAALSEAMPKILLKTVIRGITKYLATRGAKKEGGKIAGVIANILTAAAERADTRAWITLPNDIQIARLRVPPGELRLTLRYFDSEGRVVATQDGGVHVFEAGRRRYVSWRSYD